MMSYSRFCFSVLSPMPADVPPVRTLTLDNLSDADLEVCNLGHGNTGIFQQELTDCSACTSAELISAYK